MELQDKRVQDGLRRELDAKLRMAVFDAIEGGLNPDLAFKAVQSVFESEKQYAESRRLLAISYA